MRSALSLALGIVALAAPSAALAQSTSPFAPGVPQGPVTVPTASTPTVTTAAPTTTTTSSGGSSFSGGSAIAIAIGALVLIGGIGAFIWYDARRRAPVRHRAAAAAAGAGGSSGSKPRPKSRKLSPAERRRRKRGRAR